MVEFLVGLALGLKGGAVMGYAAAGKRRAVDQGDHAVEQYALANVGPAESLDKGLRQSEAGGLDDDVVGARVALQELFHAWQEVVGHGAAYAAIGELYDVVAGAVLGPAVLQHIGVHAYVAELVDDEGKAPAAGLLDDVAYEGGLAGAEEACDHRGRDALLCHGVTALGCWLALGRCRVLGWGWDIGLAPGVALRHRVGAWYGGCDIGSAPRLRCCGVSML